MLSVDFLPSSVGFWRVSRVLALDAVPSVLPFHPSPIGMPGFALVAPGLVFSAGTPWSTGRLVGPALDLMTGRVARCLLSLLPDGRVVLS